ncbi:phage major capsid protein [Bradyrhizobium cenepequi]
MGDHGLADLVREVHETRDFLRQQDNERTSAIGELKGENAALRRAVDNIILRISRPGSDHGEFSPDADRAAARALLELKHHLHVTKRDPQQPFVCTEAQLDDAVAYTKAFGALLHTTDIGALAPEYRKALSSFAFGSNGFILPPEMSDRIISCIVDPTDVTSLFDNVAISSGSVKFLIDNANIDVANWACDTSCFANNPTGFDLSSMLGELEIKAEALRYIACATSDLLEDSGFNVENWLMGKVSRAMRTTVSAAVMTGDGIGKPAGILRPQSGIPVCETSDNTPAGQFTWADLVMLRFTVPMQFWSADSAYLMNQNTAGLMFTMSDAAGRPIMVQNMANPLDFRLLGSPVKIASQMPDVAPGTTPVAFGNWKQAYTIANRKAVTMLQDPYSAGFCRLFKFEARIGGAVTCANAARLLRVN